MDITKKIFFLIQKYQRLKIYRRQEMIDLNLFILRLHSKRTFMSDSFGIVDLKSELLIKNYDVDKQIDVISNEFNWISNSWVNKFGFENEFLWD